MFASSGNVATCVGSNDQRSDPPTHADDEILIEYEKRLNRTDRALFVSNREIPYSNSSPNRIFHQLVKAMIFALTGESTCPVTALRQFRP